MRDGNSNELKVGDEIFHWPTMTKHKITGFVPNDRWMEGGDTLCVCGTRDDGEDRVFIADDIQLVGED